MSKWPSPLSGNAYTEADKLLRENEKRIPVVRTYVRKQATPTTKA